VTDESGCVDLWHDDFHQLLQVFQCLRHRNSRKWGPHQRQGVVSELSLLLAERYEQYKDQPFTDVLVFRIANITGWSAS
jgi:hypothetical protein